METTQHTQEPQYILENIILLESNFKRLPSFEVKDQSKVVQDLGVHITNTDLNLLRFSVNLEVTMSIKYEGNEIVNIKTITAGVFRKNGNFEEKSLVDFVNINAPAIIFPFVRETVASLSVKALLGPVLIQPVNFVQLYKESQAEKS